MDVVRGTAGWGVDAVGGRTRVSGARAGVDIWEVFPWGVGVGLVRWGVGGGGDATVRKEATLVVLLLILGDPPRMGVLADVFKCTGW